MGGRPPDTDPMPVSLKRLTNLLASWKRPIAIASSLVIVAVLFYAIIALDRYRQQVTGLRYVPLLLEDMPAWAHKTDQLRQRIIDAAGGVRLPLAADTARQLTARLGDIAWLDKIQVRLTPQDIRVRAYWRKPAASLEISGTRFYVDYQQVVLDYIPIPELDIKHIYGLALPNQPIVGQSIDSRDLQEALGLLALLEAMEARTITSKPLLSEIDGIDISNYQGRRDQKAPHIVILAKDGTQIIWGAEIGHWGSYLEASDEEKLARLFSFYKESGTLMGLVKYIDLRSAQYHIPSPIDQYQLKGN